MPVPLDLGPPPWDKGRLTEAYFRNFTATREAIKAHPGYVAHRDLESLGISLAIFRDSARDLRNSISSFRDASDAPQFWSRRERETLARSELAVRRGVFSVAASALALVHHSRAVVGRFPVSGYDERKSEFAEWGIHRFVQDLRNCILHSRPLVADWRASQLFGEPAKVHFFLRRDVLLAWDGWSAHARKLIEASEYGIDVESTFDEYEARVVRFHDWLRGAIEELASPALGEYREYERFLHSISSKCSWNLILAQIVIPKRLDLYTYLKDWMTDEELSQVRALQDRSQAQVDKIIEIIDEFGACDDELRAVVYRVFGVGTPIAAAESDTPA